MTGFPLGLHQPARFVGPLPDRVDTAVIGGGIIGVMTALYLARAGQKVVVCEKGRVAGEQSGRNWGWIRQQGRDFAELPIMMESLRLWQDLARQLPEGLGFRQAGVLYLARSEAEVAGFEAWLSRARPMGVDSRMLSRGEVAELLPDHGADWRAGLITQSDARAEPWVALPLIAALAETEGVTIREDCAVRRLDRAAGRVAGVVTESGRISCDQVVLAGGAWSSLFLRAEGMKLAQLSVLASVAATKPMADIGQVSTADDRFAFRRRLDGGYTVATGARHDFFLGPDAFRHLWPFRKVAAKDRKSTRLRAMAPRHFPDAWSTPRRWEADQITPFERQRVLNPNPDKPLLRRAIADFAQAFPGRPKPRLATAWAGMIDTTPDIVPYVAHASLPGLIIATGLCGHGFGIGPGMGRVVADLVLGRDPGHDLHRFRLERFGPGSILELGPTL